MTDGVCPAPLAADLGGRAPRTLHRCAGQDRGARAPVRSSCWARGRCPRWSGRPGGKQGLRAEHTQAPRSRGGARGHTDSALPRPPARRRDRLGAEPARTQVCPHARRCPLSASRPGQPGPAAPPAHPPTAAPGRPGGGGGPHPPLTPDPPSPRAKATPPQLHNRQSQERPVSSMVSGCAWTCQHSPHSPPRAGTLAHTHPGRPPPHTHTAPAQLSRSN